jgi:hypothetical protein
MAAVEFDACLAPLHSRQVPSRRAGLCGSPALHPTGNNAIGAPLSQKVAEAVDSIVDVITRVEQSHPLKIGETGS